MIFIKEKFRKIYDCIILDEIDKNRDFSLNKLSSQLRCSKSIIIDRIETLIGDGFIDIANNGFILTESGRNIKLSAENYSYNIASLNDLNETLEYDWQKIYIPKEDVFN